MPAARWMRDGRAIGFALCRVAGPEIELLLVAVVPEARGQGLGRLLVEHITAHAARLGATDLFLEVRENNLVARRLYRQSGLCQRLDAAPIIMPEVVDADMQQSR